MPNAATVWAVKLGRGLVDEREGTLALGPDDLTFEAADGLSHVRIPLVDLRGARRVRGSPVLLVSHQAGERTEQVAFYFVQPPPLEPEPVTAIDHRAALSAARLTRRKTRRQNVRYLGLWNREKKAEVQQWAAAIRSAMQASER
ncbi:MAG: hypothetical protein AB1551_00990 [Actinomycetota bacterium]